MIFKTQPYKHQQEAFDKFKDMDAFALFFDMGTGKSKTAIDIAVHKYLKGEIDAVMVIAPNNIHTQWIDEQFPLHCGVPYKAVKYKASHLHRRYYENSLRFFLSNKIEFLKVFAINVEAFQTKTHIPYVASFVKTNRVMIILDESTRIKNPNAVRSKNIHLLQKYGCRCILTGTPVTKSPFNLWSQFEFLKKNYFDCNYFVFEHRFGIMMRSANPITGKPYNTLIDEKTFAIVKHHIAMDKKDIALRGYEPVLTAVDYERIGAMHGVSESNVKYIDTHDTFQKFKNLEQLKKLIEPLTMVALKTDCLDLPPKVYETVFVDMPEEQQTVYKNLKEKLYAEYRGQELTVTNKMSLTLRLMQVCGGFFPYDVEAKEERVAVPISDKNAKINALLDDLEEVNFETTKVIVWCAFVAELQAVHKALSKTYNCALYYGGVDSEKRAEIANDFKAGKYDIFIGNTATGGFGLNFQHATLQYFYSNTYKVEDRLQAEDRSHRNGMIGTCVYKDIVYKHTMDEKVHENIGRGRDMNDYFKDMSVEDMLKDTEEADY